MFGKEKLSKMLFSILIVAFLLAAALLAGQAMVGAGVMTQAPEKVGVRGLRSMEAEGQGGRGADGWRSGGAWERRSASLTLPHIQAQTRTIIYTYDDAGRLVGADYGGGYVITYTYDAAGNLLSRVIIVPTPTPTVTPTEAPTPIATSTPTPTPTVVLVPADAAQKPLARGGGRGGDGGTRGQGDKGTRGWGDKGRGNEGRGAESPPNQR